MATDGIPAWRRLVFLSAMLFVVSTAEAQETSPTSTPNPAWAVNVETKLRLDAAQSAEFKRFVTTASPHIGTGDDQASEKFRAMTSPQRLDYIVANIETDLNTMRAGAAAMRAFYATLTPGQRTLLDDSMLPHPGHLATGSDAISDTPPPAANFQLPSHTDPDWKVRPTVDDVARVYPTAALAAKVSGKAVLSCAADIDGFLTDCVIRDESPPGYGFGNAALEISAYMQMKPASNFGVPARAQVNVPVNFAMQEAGADHH